MPGVKAMLTADDLPAPADTLTDNGTVIKANKRGDRGLTMEPVYQGDPILAVAAVDELTAAEAIEKIDIDFEPLPFVIDPLVSSPSRRPESAHARAMYGYRARRAPGGPQGAMAPPEVTELKWTEADFAEDKDGRLPMGKRPTNGRSAMSMRASRMPALVLDETFVTPDTSHQSLETRTAMAYWQNGKVYIHTGTQSTAQTVPGDRALAEHRSRNNVVFISEYTGGGFGSKITGAHHDDHSRAAGEENERSGDDAHQPRRRALHRPRPAQLSWPHESRLLEGRHASPRSTCS